MIIILATFLLLIVFSIFLVVITHNSKLKNSKLKNSKSHKCDKSITEKEKLYLSQNQIQNITYPSTNYKWGGFDANKPTVSTKFKYI
jgi:hypothetical protein